MKLITPSLLALTLLVAFATPARAQLGASIGAGVATPQGDLEDAYDSGYTARAQLTLSALGLFEVHGQAGWTRFPAKSDAVDDLDQLHAGAGARLSVFPLVFVGANAAYFFGDADEEVGFFPEVGVGLGPLEVVLDYRVGDEGWLGIRGALKL